MTIKGVKKFLNKKDFLELDENFNESIKAKDIKERLIKISDILKSLKKNR